MSAEQEVVTGSEELARSIGITYRKMDYWCKLGYLQPLDPEPGSGYERLWPGAELEIARRMGRLAAAGLPLAFAAHLARDAWPAAELAPGITVTVAEAAP